MNYKHLTILLAGITIFVTIILWPKTSKIMNKNNSNLLINNPIGDIICNGEHTYMSTAMYPTILHINGNKCNINLTLTKFNGEEFIFNSLTVNDKGITNFGKFYNNGIFSVEGEFFIPAPSKLMAISLKELKTMGGKLHTSDNKTYSIVPLGNDIFKINNSKFRLDIDKIFKQVDNPNPLIGELASVDGLIKWVKWISDGQPLTYDTISP